MKKNTTAIPISSELNKLYLEACELVDTSGMGEESKYQQGLELLKKAANEGHLRAMNDLGMMYYRGYGVKQNYDEAKKWFQRASEGGNNFAYSNLALMYEKGQGVPKNTQRALYMYLVLAKEGDAEAMEDVGRMYYNGVDGEPNYEKAVSWNLKSAKELCASGIDQMGWCYLFGHGVTKDPLLAMQYYAFAALRRNDPYAMVHIASMYHSGKNVKEDHQQALKWDKFAARYGLGGAMHDIGQMYENGEGVSSNKVVAYCWYKRAASHGYPKAQKDLNDLLLPIDTTFQCPLQNKSLDDNFCKKVNTWLFDYHDEIIYAAVDNPYDWVEDLPPITDWISASKLCPSCPMSMTKDTALELICPCCGKSYIEFYYGYFREKCPTCGWGDDLYQSIMFHRPHRYNKMSLGQARLAYKKGTRFPNRNIRSKQLRKALSLDKSKVWLW